MRSRSTCSIGWIVSASGVSNATRIALQLQGEGAAMVDLRQGYALMVPPTR